MAYNKFESPVKTENFDQAVTDNKPVIQEGANYYLTSDVKNTGNGFSLYKYAEASNKSDEKIATFPWESYGVVSKSAKSHSYIVWTRNGVGGEGEEKIQILDVASAKLEPLFDIEKDVTLGNFDYGDSAVSADGSKFAYARNYVKEEGNLYGELWVFDFNTKEQKQIGSKLSLKENELVSVKSWRDEDSEIVLQVVGSNDKEISGDIYQVNISKGEFAKVTKPDAKNVQGFLNGVISPDHDQWLYQFCTQPDDAVRSGNKGFDDACTSGTELRTYDFTTKQTKTVYQNLRFDKDPDKSTLQTFKSFVWQDSKTIVAAVPGAILSIPLGNPDKTEEILTFEDNGTASLRSRVIVLVSANVGEIIFNQSLDSVVYDRVSNKAVIVNPLHQQRSISAWLD